MRQIRLLGTIAVIAFIGFQTASRQTFSQNELLTGFDREHSAAERRWEEKFREVPAPASAREHLRKLTAEPHVAGSKEDYATAIYVRDQMKSYGLNGELKEYQVLLPSPKSPSIVELVTPHRQRLDVKEAVVPQDPSSSNPKIIPLFNGYGATGDVTAPLVYVNYGLPPDYEALAKAGVDVKGKIAIARYGNSFRGVKAKVAEDHGAIGLLIYSDPADDGYAQGDVYPKGPWRPSTSAQRGSVEFLFVYPGDPLTPGTPAVTGTPRIKIQEAKNLPRIPVQPISYGDARVLLEPLKGPVRPRGFQGGLPFAYHTGGTTDVRVHLKTDIDFKTQTIWDVIARIDGQAEKDRWVIMGNHRDAWTFGAVDPNSGTAAMLEVARGYGKLIKDGWKPRRSIILCSWDAEEQGLIGSTEWVEENAEELRTKAVAYLNVDVAVSGPNFGASSVPSLWKLIRGSSRDVKDPKSGKSIYQQWQDHAREQRPESEKDKEANIGALGSGSDFTPFLQHLGIPSSDMGFGGDYGVYHSAYDSFYWMSQFGDPDFVYHAAAAELWGTIAMRLASSDALPLDYTDYANQVRDYFNDNVKKARDRSLADSFDEKAMSDAINEFADAAAKIEREKNRAVEDKRTARLKRINDALIAAERDFIDERGLNGRPWFRHEIYAPGIYTGYAAQPLTDFNQALDDRNKASAKESLTRIVAALKRATQTLKRAAD